MRGPGPGAAGTDGRPLPRLYAIRPGDTAAIQFRMLDGLNALRRAAAAPALALSAELNAAAFTHSRDMAVQNRPWHFGSDGSSPIDRARRVGYGGSFLGELISETYETELQTLAAWMEAPQTRDILLNPAAANWASAISRRRRARSGGRWSSARPPRPRPRPSEPPGLRGGW